MSRVIPEKLVKRSSPTQKIPRILWNLKVHYRIHNSQTPVHILSKLDTIHAPPSLFSKTHFNIILSSTPVVSFPQVSPLNPVCTSFFFTGSSE
jgi:hypothetical protein